MRKGYFALLFSGLLLATPLWGEEVFVSGANQAAMQAKADLEKYTHYRLSDDHINATLAVNELSWSPDFLSPATTAIQMDLISSRGELLWSKTEPVGSRQKDAVIEGLLKDLAQAKPNLSGTSTKAAGDRVQKEINH